LNPDHFGELLPDIVDGTTAKPGIEVPIDRRSDEEKVVPRTF
jgi:hypothetical protein